MSKNQDLGELINGIKSLGTNQLNAPAYTSATSFTGTLAGLLGFDSSGNIITTAPASIGVTSFNTRTGAVTLSSSDVTGALGYTPYDTSNPAGYITSAALGGYVPTSRTLTINGTTFDLSDNRSWTISGSSQWTTSGSNIYFTGGFVGINTSSPQYILDVSGGARFTAWSSMGINARFAWNMISDQYLADGYAGAIRIDNTDGRFSFYTAASGVAGAFPVQSERFTITNGGNVGINTSAPTADYDKSVVLYGDNPTFIAQSSSDSNLAYMHFKSPTNDWSIGSSGSGNFRIANANYPNTQIRVTINSSGNLGIGIGAPAYKLDVAGDVNITGAFRINGTAIGGTGTVTGTGTSGTLPIWTGSSALGNSVLTQSSGTLSSSGGLVFSTYNTAFDTAGSITRHSVVGLVLRGVTASVFDFALYSAAGTALMTNPVGSNNINFNSGQVWFNGGNVGIGTTSPTGKFSINTGASNQVAFFNNSSSGSTYNIISLNGTYSEGTNMGIEGGGSGDANLYVNGGYTSSTNGGIIFRLGSASTYTEFMRIMQPAGYSSKTLAIRTTSPYRPNAGINVYGNLNITSQLDSLSGTHIEFVVSNGQIVGGISSNSTTTTYSTSSDYRLKYELLSSDPSAFKNCDELPPVTLKTDARINPLSSMKIPVPCP